MRSTGIPILETIKVFETIQRYVSKVCFVLCGQDYVDKRLLGKSKSDVKEDNKKTIDY